VSGFVVCQSCGTRIKAGRGHCLRCFEPLPDVDAPPRTPLSVSLGLSRNAEIGLLVGAALAVALLLVVIWQTWPVPADESVMPATNALLPPAPADGDVPGAAAEPLSAAPVAATADPEPDLDAARAGLEEKLAARPRDHELMNRLGQLLERMGRKDDAAARFESAVALAPLEPAYRINLARAAGELGQLDRAVDQYREAMRLRPKDFETLNVLAATLQKKGDAAGAVAEFERASRLSPSSAPAALGLATSLEKVGRVDEAIVQFRRYLDLGPAPGDVDRVKGHLAILTRGRPQVK
jgi:tetratricopeptide (TPR) repeat protein